MNMTERKKCNLRTYQLSKSYSQYGVKITYPLLNDQMSLLELLYRTIQNRADIRTTNIIQEKVFLSEILRTQTEHLKLEGWVILYLD